MDTQSYIENGFGGGERGINELQNYALIGCVLGRRRASGLHSCGPRELWSMSCRIAAGTAFLSTVQSVTADISTPTGAFSAILCTTEVLSVTATPVGGVTTFSVDGVGAPNWDVTGSTEAVVLDTNDTADGTGSVDL